MKTVLGIELGSTRIKAVAIDGTYAPVSSGDYTWASSYENGVWTYDLNEVWKGLKIALSGVENRENISAMGVSAMMHGYLAFDKDWNLLTPFRTWQNTITGQAAEKLTALFGFNIPQRWSIAHLYQAILNGEAHVPQIAHITTLAGYVHYMLTGVNAIGIGEASGMFPIDSEKNCYDEGMLARFEELVANRNLPWKLLDVLPKVLAAGEKAGYLTESGAARLDNLLAPGIPFAPAEGDAGTGMTATNAVAPRTGNVSAGTSIFSMVVLERPLKKVYEEIDLVTTPIGKPVAMVHCNNCTNDSNAWVSVLKETAELFGTDPGSGEVYTKLYTELIITFMSAFAQSESESISANVRWGKKQAMKEGKVNFPIWKLYGYGINNAGEVVIVPEQAEIVRRIYTRILAGDSLRIIRDTLNADSVPAKGGKQWHESTVRGIITNEKYCGDVLMQKTFKTDVISGKIAKNTGQLPMYLIQDNHPGIVTRDTFQAVQTELARRSAGKSPSRKNAATGRSCYTSKYALSERMLCGECGTRYQRCSWHRKDKVRIVWRCVSRVEYGSRYCHQSPTMDEEPLQRAIMAAISSVMAPKDKIHGLITDAALEETCKLPNSAVTLGDINQRLEELEAEFNSLFNQSGGIDKNTVKYREIANEMAALKEQRERISTQLRNHEAVQAHVHTMAAALDQEDHHLTEWDEEMIRQLVHTVKVISADQIRVYLNDGTEIDQTVGP